MFYLVHPMHGWIASYYITWMMLCAVRTSEVVDVEGAAVVLPRTRRQFGRQE